MHRFSARAIAFVILAASAAVWPAAAMAQDDADPILDDLSRRAWNWFEKHRHPETGLVLDRGKNDAASRVDPAKPAMCSIAGVGFYLSMLPEGVRLKYLPEDEARRRAVTVLSFVRDQVEHHEGVCYHFVDWRSGRRWDKCEVSTLDTAILLLGAGTAGQRFGGEASELATELLDRADWTRFVVRDDQTGKQFLSLGWSPEKGLFGPCDVRSAEMAMPIFLAVAARHSVDPECWYNTAVRRGDVGGREVLNPEHPLFTSQYGLLWWDLAGRADADGIDLFANAKDAGLAHRAFCATAAKKFPTFAQSSGGWWGISAGDSPQGYVAPQPHLGHIDGTVWPTAAVASYAWIPAELRGDLIAWHKSDRWEKVCGPYGLAPFRAMPEGEWIAPDMLAIDLGAMFLSIANQRNRTVWDLWMAHPAAKTALVRLRLEAAR